MFCYKHKSFVEQIQFFYPKFVITERPQNPIKYFFLSFASPNAYPTVVHKWVTFWNNLTKKSNVTVPPHFTSKIKGICLFAM